MGVITVYYIDNYKDLCKQVEIHIETVEILETEKYALEKLLVNNAPKDIKGLDYSSEGHGSKNFTSFDRTYTRLQEVKRKIKIEKELYMEMADAKENVKVQIASLDGIFHKVAFLRDIEGMKLKDIAKKLCKTEGYIENISSKLNAM